MRALATSLLALAACHSDGSLEVWVQPPPGVAVDEVELYVGIHAPHIGESIRPQLGALAETVWWKRDHNRDQDILVWDAEAAERGAVRYQMIADGLDEVRALVAVGYATDSGSKKIVGVATYMHDSPIGSGEIYRRYLTLGEFDLLPRARDQESRENVPGIQIWGPPDDPGACVQIDNAPELDLTSFGTGAATSSMIVLHDDRDCDGYKVTEAPNKDECTPAEFDSFAARTRDSLEALMLDKVPGIGGGGSVDVCVGAGPTCRDGAGDIARAPSSWCAPTPLCGSGMAPPCDDFACDTLPAGVPRVECAFTYDPASMRWCGGAASFVLAQTFTGVACDPMRGTKLRKPLMPVWMTELVYGSGDEMRISIDPKDEGTCTYEFKVSGPLQPFVTMTGHQLTYRAAISYPLQSGRGLVLPLAVHAEQSVQCAYAGEGCQILPLSWSDVPLRSCLAAPISDPATYVP